MGVMIRGSVGGNFCQGFFTTMRFLHGGRATGCLEIVVVSFGDHDKASIHEMIRDVGRCGGGGLVSGQLVMVLGCCGRGGVDLVIGG